MPVHTARAYEIATAIIVGRIAVAKATKEGMTAMTESAMTAKPAVTTEPAAMPPAAMPAAVAKLGCGRRSARD
jgi:hypothetical protein